MASSAPITTPSTWGGGGRSHEAKFTLHGSAVPNVMALMQERLSEDDAFPTARISSLYYDTPDLRFVYDKRNSDYLKQKVRLRWYDNPSTGVTDPDAFFEVKNKNGAIRRKFRVALRGEAPHLAALDLASAELEALPTRLAEDGPPLPVGLEPLLVVSYLRKRFVLERTQTRISLDWDIRMPRSHPRFGPVPNRPLDTAVVELKGDLRALPPELQELSALGVRMGAFSKYGQWADRLLGAVSAW
ncbi:MAG: polyphosphate polymerase domain-containing protein [Planctomycetota bacterium]|nr:polyphosphate polymerase domain-containing protein [Planctomycetota bacterium]